MARFTAVTFTTGSVSGSGGTLNYDVTVLANILDVCRIKITPSISAGTQKVEIFSHAARAASQLLYSTAAWTATAFNEPADNLGAEVLQGWVIPYYDADESLKLHLKFTNNHSVAKTYDVEIDYEYQSTATPGVVGAPEGLYASAMANGLSITSGVVAERNNSTILAAEFRAKRLAQGVVDSPQDLRTVAEGGSWVPDGVDNLQVTGISAGPNGAQHTFTSGSAGRWYFTWRLQNSVGWSRWTEGNVNPSYVIQWVDTELAALADTGPPTDWEVWLENGPASGTVIVHATRPRLNGRNLLWWFVQIKDGSTGTWKALADGSSPSAVLYDGSATSHTLSADRLTITKATSGWGSAAPGDLILLDVRGATWNEQYCQWATVETISGASLVFTSPGFRPQTYSNLRLKIVTPPWNWSSGGYLGSQDNRGIWPSGQDVNVNPPLGLGWIFGGYEQQEFVSPPINVPVAVTQPEARVWFENNYSRSDDTLNHSTGVAGGTGVWVAPRTFEDFNDRDLWLPIYPPTTWGTLTFSTSTKKVTMATGTNTSAHQGGCGVKARFRLYPDSAGGLMIYAKWTDVTLPVGTAATDYLGLGIVLFNAKTYDHHTFGAGLTNNGTTPGYVVFDAIFNRPRTIVAGSSPDNISYIASTNFARPPAGSIVEMRTTITQRTWYGNRMWVCDPIEVRIGAVGAYTVGRSSYPREGFGIASFGLEMFFGWIGNCRLTGATATLDTVTVLNGIAEVI